jgi:hypothetical protein
MSMIQGSNKANLHLKSYIMTLFLKTHIIKHVVMTTLNACCRTFNPTIGTFLSVLTLTDILSLMLYFRSVLVVVETGENHRPAASH